jgi:hypothetical protein
MTNRSTPVDVNAGWAQSAVWKGTVLMASAGWLGTAGLGDEAGGGERRPTQPLGRLGFGQSGHVTHNVDLCETIFQLLDRPELNCRRLSDVV